MDNLKALNSSFGANAGATPIKVSESVGPGRAGVVVESAGEAGEKPSFKEVWGQIQSKMGAKAEKPREIKKTLDKDDFLKIMVTQMKHQDPTKPFDADKLAEEMAQITSVEQMQNMNKTLTSMTTQNRPLERLAMTSMIGKTVTLDRGRFAHKEGDRESLSFTLGGPAKKVKLNVMDEAGQVIFEKDMGPQNAGVVSLDWDGKSKNTVAARSGLYTIKVEAKNDQEAEVQTASQVKARVVGISFEGAEPSFIVGDAKHQEKISMSNVVQIDTSDPTVIPKELITPPPGTSKPNFFTFKPGEGSQNVESQGLDPAAQEALNRYMAQQAQQKTAGTVPELKAAPQEPGFPNGLADYQEKPTQIAKKGGDTQ